MEVGDQLHTSAALSQEMSPWYPTDRRLHGTQSQSGCSSEEKYSQPLPGLYTLITQPIAQHYTTELSGLLKTV